MHPKPLNFRHETTADFIATSGEHRVDYVFQIKFGCTAAVGQLAASTVLLFSIADTCGKSFLLNTRCLRQYGYNHRNHRSCSFAFPSLNMFCVNHLTSLEFWLPIALLCVCVCARACAIYIKKGNCVKVLPNLNGAH